MHDLVIRNALLVDGSGSAAHPADIAISEGVIADIAPSISERASESLDAEGMLVMPGFIDIHTHYDGQVTWDDALEPSSSHGVTTIVMGNCGVGFAPVKRGQEGELIELMEGVEDIPGTALHEGIDFVWESFPEYMDLLSQKRWSMDVATQLPHGPLRVYVMGKRGIENEAATDEDVAAMKQATAEAMEAGALGFSSSRILGHMSMSGKPVPGTFAHEDELFAIAQAMVPYKTVFEVVPGGSTGRGGQETSWSEEALSTELEWMGRLSKECGLPVTYFMIEYLENPNAWREAFEFTANANQTGSRLYPQVGTRPAGALLSWRTSHPFVRRPTYVKLSNLPWEQRLEALRKQEVRDAIVNEKNLQPVSELINDRVHLMVPQFLDRVFLIASQVDYEQPTEQSVAGIANRSNKNADEVMYDHLLTNEGTGTIIMLPNYLGGNSDSFHSMLVDPNSVIGLADAGAHCGFICDASCSTWLLSHWARDRKRGTLPLEYAIKKHTSDNAGLYGLSDRGVLAVGKRADINVVDFDNLTIDPPHLVHDLPAGGPRFLQSARGYRATIVDGILVRENDQDTGARPGRLVRGRR